MKRKGKGKLLNFSREKDENKSEEDLNPHSLDFLKNIIKHWF